MKHQFMVNGVVNLVLIPENDLEKALLQTISVQQNSFKEITKSSPQGALFNDGSIVIEGGNATKTKEMQ